MDEAVEDGVGQCGVANELVPVIDGELAGDEGGGAANAIVDHLKQVAPLLGGHGRDAPVVEDQQIDLGECLEQAGIASETPSYYRVEKTLINTLDSCSNSENRSISGLKRASGIFGNNPNKRQPCRNTE